ncbi:hypothetical protein ACN27F_15645 [Solwaraspora sp. WMMB335]|uniref:hypothetical protein n=1 Tax=Solwaraspora sp. WMMB335 TaxID=3404118 RepID=UPI003B962DF3
MRTGGKPTGTSVEVAAAMEILVVLVIFVLLTVASAAGLTRDSRDSLDWQPTQDGSRQPR